MVILPFLGPMTVLALWFTITSSGLIKPLYLPTPQSVTVSLLTVKDSMLNHVGSTLLRIIVGYVLGITLGLLFGLVMSYNKYVFAFFNSIIESARPVPPVALIPFFILWFGFSNIGKIVFVMLGVALIIIVNTIEAVQNVNPTYIRAAYSLGTTKLRIFSSVILPAIVPELRSGLRIALALAVSLVIVSEFLGADTGIGYLINISKVTFNTPAILLSIVILGMMSWILDVILQTMLNRMTQWSEKSTEALE